MKTLLLLRHAKASHDDAGGDDKAQPLTRRGRSDAQSMGKAIRKLDVTPDQILCSTAVRTRETIDAVLEEIEFEGEVDYEDGVYLAHTNRLMELLGKKGTGNTVLLVGHNPGMQELVASLSSGGTLAVAFPTAALARIDFNFDNWKEIEDARGELIWLMTPEVVEEL